MSFVAPSFDIPSRMETADFRLRMLTIHDLVKDFDAVASSVDHLQGLFGPEDPWPLGITLQQDLVDLGWHQKEFELRRSFTYTVMAPDESRCLGCVYIYPCDKSSFEAMVFLWVRSSERHTGLDGRLFESVQAWLKQDWPFDAIAYPGRTISWQQWQGLR